MTFGSAILHSHRKRGGGRKPKLYDCGALGRLSTRQIAAIAGVTPKGIRDRIRVGIRGEALCETTGEKFAARRMHSACRSPVMYTAMRLALAFPGRVPSIEEIQAVRPMSRPAAVRWKSVITDARKAA